MKKSNTNVAKMVGILRWTMGAAVAGWLSVAGVSPAQAQKLSSMNLGGYLGVNCSGAPDSFNAGYSMYVAMLGRSQYAYYSSGFGASLQPGTWMGAQNSKAKCYFDIEGGAGPGGWYGNVWCNNGFGMGVVGPGFAGVANGTSGGWGQHGLYAVAQISPRLLFPPKVEMFRGGTCGQFAGYGYLALPLLPGKATTAGFNVPTGNHWWTFFFNTRNFQGPVATVIPYFWSQFTTNHPEWAGQLLDSCWAGPNKPISSESHDVPGKEYDGPEGSYVRVEPMFVALNHSTNASIVINSPTVYDQTALWNAAQQWFTNNGPAPVGPFNAQGAVAQTVSGGGLGWGVWHSPLKTNGSMPMAMRTYLTPYTPDSKTLGYQWGTNQVTFTQFANGTPAVVMPEYYQLQKGVWTPISPGALPPNVGSKLASVNLADSPPVIGIPETWRAPKDPCWTNPGPAAGPFQARLDDGMVVTYRWYRFADQPALMMAGLTQAERDQLQAEAVKIHSAWTNGGAYLASPTMGTLADVDPALLVTPPTGKEVGYVPIATSEAWGGWVTNTWKDATSGKWSVAAHWASGSAPAAGGHSYYSFNFAPSGTCTATNDLGNGYGYGGYAVNQLNFAGAVTITGNPITLTTDYGSLPRISQNSDNAVVINAPLNLDVTTVLGGTGSGLVDISNVISGPWQGLTIHSPGTWRLSGTNTYSGATCVKTGTLSCSQAASLGSGALSISNGAVVSLTYSGARTISALTLGGINMPAGDYGSPSSSATSKDSHFSGAGTVTVPVR